MNAQGSQYEIVQKLGEGGMGTVYLANDVMLDRQVAIKQLNKTSDNVDENLGDRFQQEALALAKLNHPNITHLYSFIPKQDTYWMVMEFVEGKTLESWLHIHNKITHPLAASIAVQMLDGLHHAHKKGIVHRDIKPANIMINEDGEVKIMDFGIARMKNTQRVTRHGKSVGTLEYMSPEQIQGQEGDERTDIYAVGNIMYELLCGIPPFRSDADYQLMKDKLEKDPQPIITFNPSVPPALQKVIFKALERKPEKRFQNAHEFKQAIEKCMTGLLLSQSELTQVLKASQEFTTPRKSSEPVSINTLLSRAKNISGNIKVPDMKKVNKPVVLLAASVLLCAILLIWNAASSGNTEVDNTQEQSISLVEDIPQENELTQTVATNGSLLNETPAELYDKIQNQNNGTNIKQNTTEKKTQPSSNNQKKTQSAKKDVVVDDDEIEETRYSSARNTRSTTQPVDVPAGKNIRVTLAENLSSEDESRDGGMLRFTCAENVEAGGRTIIQRGAIVTGKIVDVVSSRNERKKAVVGFTLQKVQAVDGSSIRLRSQRYRLFADEPGQSVSYRSGQSFTAELGRGRVR